MPWYNAICERCGKEFTAQRSENQSPPRFCSQECHYNTAIITCVICGKKRKIKQSHTNKVFTCGSKSCTHELKWHKFSQKISNRLGEPLESAVQRCYVLERKSYREIENELGINNRTIMRIMERLNLEPRQRGEAIATQWENNDERRKSIGKVFAEYGKQRIGPKHPRWRGGRPYDSSNKRWCERAAEIRQRDGFRCTSCGRINEECQELFGKSLSVHHIIPFRFSRDHSASNLRSLCMECHMRIEQEFIWLL